MVRYSGLAKLKIPLDLAYAKRLSLACQRGYYLQPCWVCQGTHKPYLFICAGRYANRYRLAAAWHVLP